MKVLVAPVSFLFALGSNRRDDHVATTTGGCIILNLHMYMYIELRLAIFRYSFVTHSHAGDTFISVKWRGGFIVSTRLEEPI